MKLTTRIDAAKTSQEFKTARTEINKHVRTGLANAVERAVLPRVKLLARVPAEVKMALVARATGTRGYVTTRGPRKLDRILGLLNWGGTVHGTIHPKEKKALKTPQGARALVRGPRHYKGKLFLEAAVSESVDSVETAMLEEVMKSFGELPHTP